MCIYKTVTANDYSNSIRMDNFVSTTSKLHHKKSSRDHQPCILQHKRG